MGRSRIIHLSDPEATIDFGRRLAPLLTPNSILALTGELGAGKTTLIQGLALGLKIAPPIASPTFVYLNLYEGALPLFHFDLYRLKTSADFLSMGFEEYFEKEGVCAIEWPERIVPLLPSKTLFLSLQHQSGRRILTFSFADELLDSFHSLWV